MIRDVQLSDLPTIENFHIRSGYDFPLPKESSCFLNKALLNSNGEVVGYSQVKLTTEVILILDPSRSNLEKARAIDDLVKELIKSGIKSTHVFVTDEDFKELLIKHYAFVEANCKPLYLEVK